MVKSLLSKNKINILICILLFFECVYILFEYDRLEIHKFQIESIFGGFTYYKLYFVTICLSVLVVFMFLLNSICSVNNLLLLTFLAVSNYLLLEYKIKSNSELSNLKKSREEMKRELNTGDFILFETPKKITSMFAFVPVMYININHIGIVFKDKDANIYILECNPHTDFCEYSKRKKDGVLLADFDNCLTHFDNYYAVKTNLHKHIDFTKTIQFIEKYKDKLYMENNLNCIMLVLLFLKEMGLIYSHLVDTEQLYLDYRLLLNKGMYTNPFEYNIYKFE